MLGRIALKLRSGYCTVFPLENEPQITGYRTRVEILARILKVAQKGTLKTHIMYKANLSHRQLEKYLSFLVQNNMIMILTDEEYGTSSYTVTEKGAEFLKDYAHISQMYGSEILRANA